MRILTTLTYYSPHISGLTVYARRVVAGLVRRGHEVTVLTSHYDPKLPREEQIDGARVVRVPVWFRVSKGVMMPSFYGRSILELKDHDLLFLHLPQIEAVVPAIAAKLAGKPVITIYHCDIELPKGLTSLLFFNFIRASHWLTARVSDSIVVNSEDYISGTPFLKRFPGKNVPSYPPCVLAEAAPDNLGLPSGAPVIGFVGRFAQEKGIEYILEAAPRVLEAFPDAVFAFAGQQAGVFGENVYVRLKERLNALAPHVRMLGIIADDQLANFYCRCSVVLLPSINSTESFGMVQAEAMLAGTPVVASSLPGIRQPVMATGMGELVPPRDSRALAEAVIAVLENRESYLRPAAEIESVFGLERSLDFFEELFLRATGSQAISDPSRLRQESLS